MSPLDVSLELSEHAGVLPVDVQATDRADPGANWYLEPTEGSTRNYVVDPFGINTPSYGLDMVVITGSRLSAWWTFGATYVDYGEYLAINEGGGGSGGLPYMPSEHCRDHGQDVDWDFIQTLEGNRTTAYVPSAHGAALGHSGVTIAAGFDLGQHSVKDLQTMGLSNALIGELRPYLGLTNQAAVDQLAARPLSISAAAATEINQAAHAQTLASLVVRYDAAANQDGAFYELPGEAQTVIASVAFQYGNLASATPAFWNQVVHQDWSGAVGELRNFGDVAVNRRMAEADLLQGALIDNRLHDGSHC